MRYRIELIILAILLIAQAVFSTGVSPPVVEEYMEPGLEKYINIKILNPEGNSLTVTAYADGDLEEYITFPSTLFEISPNEKEKIFSYKINLPEEVSKKGVLTTRIVILAIPDKVAGETRITANTELVSVLKVMAPAGDKYVEANLFVPGMEKDMVANIVIEVQNIGKERVESAMAVVDIMNPFGEKSAIIKSDPVSLMPKEKKSIIVPWTPEIGNGLYQAKLTLIYDGLNAEDRKQFTIGQPIIIINDISVANFKLGGIAKFDLLLESQWNQLIPETYAVMDVFGKDGTIYTTFKTVDVDIGAFGKQTVDAYWDTDKVTAGTYDLETTLNYLGKTSEDKREITVSPDGIAVSATGMVVEGGEDKGRPAQLSVNMMLIVIIILLVVVILVIVLRKKK